MRKLLLGLIATLAASSVFAQSSVVTKSCTVALGGMPQMQFRFDLTSATTAGNKLSIYSADGTQLATTLPVTQVASQAGELIRLQVLANNDMPDLKYAVMAKDGSGTLYFNPNAVSSVMSGPCK